MFLLIIYFLYEFTPITQLIRNIVVVVKPQILRKIMLLTMYPVINHQNVIGSSIINIVKNSMNRYINPNTDSRIFILSNIKFYFYIVPV
jgi:hypothetical protein